jgi:hypothetical protein
MFRTTALSLCAVWLVAGSAAGQTAEPTTRTAAIEREQAEKATRLHPHVPDTAEHLLERAERILSGGGLRWHPFFNNAYPGGGFTIGAGYRQHVSPYNMIDVRGSYTFSGYKRMEAEFVAPRLFRRRGTLTMLGGWRDATQVSFYGIGTDTSVDARTNFRFTQPYGVVTLAVRPTRRYLVIGGGVEWSQWEQRPGQGSSPSVETVYTPETLPGLGATVTYLRAQTWTGLDWRTSPGYTRRGGAFGIGLRDYTDRDDAFGFQQIDYEAIQHIPILREAWVISLRGRVETAFAKRDQQIPFFMLPQLGSGSTLRGFGSARFRDRNALLLQAEWRVMVNRFFETAVFYDAGKVTAQTSELDLRGLHSDIGFGIRFHGPLTTPLRAEIAKSREGLVFVFSASAAF